MILYGAIQMAEGLVMWLMPDRIYGYIGFDKFPTEFPTYMSVATDFVAYILAITGATLIAGGFFFIIGSFNPVKNVNAVRFAILWSALTLVGQIYTIVKGYVTFGAIWWNLLVTALFLIGFLLFFPWPWRRESYK
ncbi:MAG: hypothetical protein C4542_03090 [Dehalococcoidia bacterium]|nr:MAG: hypothetical protein C4542_03090 [Dehalococcoidia bacterium]